MSMKTVDYLITFVGLAEEEIVSLIKKTNIKGHIIVGNQKCSQYSEAHIKLPDCKIDIYNLTSKGVSRNRNFLLEKSQSDYVSFLDDDICLNSKSLELINSRSQNIMKDNISFRFNVISANPKRPIRQLPNSKKLKLFKLRQFGVCGIFFNRCFLLNNHLNFREYIGPGTSINHGEDYIFLFDYFKCGGKMIQYAEVAMSAKQEESTWQGNNRNIQKELFAQGHNYRILYRNKAKLFLFLHMLKHTKYYKNDNFTFIQTYKIGVEGIKFRKTIEKGLANYE